MNDASQHDAFNAIASRSLAANRVPRRETLRLADGYETVAYLYSPLARVNRRGTVVYAHGIQSHPAWFSSSAAELASAGFAVYQVTRRGSGENVLARGHAVSTRQLLDDVECACRFAQERESVAGQPQPPLHLLGVSWGGKLLTAYALDPRRKADIASLTLVAPGIASQVDVPLLKKLAIGLSAVVAPTKLFDIPLDDVELFTDNEEMRKYLRRDALSLHRATARFLYVSKVLDLVIRRARSGSLAVPTTLLLSDSDRIIHNGKTLESLQRLTGGKVHGRWLPGAHTLEFETNPSPFFAALVETLESVS